MYPVLNLKNCRKYYHLNIKKHYTCQKLKERNGIDLTMKLGGIKNYSNQQPLDQKVNMLTTWTNIDTIQKILVCYLYPLLYYKIANLKCENVKLFDVNEHVQYFFFVPF